MTKQMKQLLSEIIIAWILFGIPLIMIFYTLFKEM